MFATCNKSDSVNDNRKHLLAGSMGDFDTTFQLAYGRNNDAAVFLGEERDTDFANFFSASYTINMDWFTMRASYAEAELTIPFDEFTPLFDGWRATPFASIGDELEIAGDKGTFASVGFTADLESILILGEFAQVRPDGNFSSERDAYYLTIGKRFRDVLLHVTYGADERNGDFSILAQFPLELILV